MSSFLLIHGSWHGGWCWKKIVPLLQQAGHTVLAPDLPGHGEDPTPIEECTPEREIQRLEELLAGFQEPAFLVGHSSGGMLITELARRHPWKVRGLVYLSAFLLPPGVLPPMLMREDTESILGASLEVDEERKQVRVRKEAARTVFYADCSEEDVARAISLLVPEPLRPRVEEAASRLSVRESEALPRYYIECLQDKALGPSMQRKMYTSLPCQKVYSLPTSHSPFLSAPERLAECLLDIARSQPKRDAHSEASKHPSVASGTDEHEG